VTLEHVALAHDADVPRPDRRAGRDARPEERRVDRRVRRPPERGDAPRARGRADLVRVGLARRGGDVDEVAQPPQRLVRPRMRREQERVVRRRRREDPVHADPRRHRGRDHLVRRRRRGPLDPLRAVVHLEQERDSRPDERAQVVDVPVELLLPGLDESRGEELVLEAPCVRDEQVDVAVAAQRRIRVARADLRPLEDHERAVAALADAAEQERDGQRDDRRLPLLLDEVAGHEPPERAPAARREELEVVRAQPVEVACAVDERVDGVPEAAVDSSRRRRLHGDRETGHR
jgi:hypothetical protein